MGKIIKFTEWVVTVYGPSTSTGRPANTPTTTLTVEEQPAVTTRTISFCGRIYELPTLTQEEFDQLYDEAVDYRCDLEEDGAMFKMSDERRSKLAAAVNENDEVLEALEAEYERRERGRRLHPYPSLAEIYG